MTDTLNNKLGSKIAKFKHDSFFKNSLSIAQVAREFMQTHLPAKVLEVINLETLTIQPDSFVKKSLNKQITDVLFSCQINNQVNDQTSAFIYVLCEHQSKPDHWMSFRMLKYIIAICTRYLKKHPKAKTLPLIFPLVFYNGREKYSAPLSVYDLFSSPSMAKDYLASYKLVDVTKVDDDELKAKHWAGTMAFFMKHAFERDVIKLLQQFSPILQQITQVAEGLDFFESILWYNISKVEKHQYKIFEQQVKNITDNNKADQVIGSLVQSWLNQGIDKGINIGIDKGKAEGRTEEKYQIAKKLLLKKTPIDEISDITSLSIEEIKQLSKDIQ
jgi:predicted transposase/invertase (TIGR01784 family)